VYLFLGTGMDTQNITVKYNNNNNLILYSNSSQYCLDLAALDAQKGYHYITTPNSTANNYQIIPAQNVNLTVTVNSATTEWKSGDLNAEMFSGTRVAVIYPALYNLWFEGYSNNATAAKNIAVQNLTDYLSRNNITVTGTIQNQSIWVGDLPNQATVRLELWTH
ncbi:MAG TPA: hypothetical protein VK426_11025, partial [Methanobacterium sp.]|nr:hypothetical protein [Methanobacterium sp.]